MIPEELTRDLSRRGLDHEVVEDGPRIFIVFKGYELPDGLYNVQKTDLMVFTTQFYPNAGFDMFWVDQELRLKGGGVPRSADQIESYMGKSWRRFSYHPYNVKPWNPSEDSVISFLTYVDQRLRKGD